MQRQSGLCRARSVRITIHTGWQRVSNRALRRGYMGSPYPRALSKTRCHIGFRLPLPKPTGRHPCGLYATSSSPKFREEERAGHCSLCWDSAWTGRFGGRRQQPASGVHPPLPDKRSIEYQQQDGRKASRSDAPRQSGAGCLYQAFSGHPLSRRCALQQGSSCIRYSRAFPSPAAGTPVPA